MQNLFNPKKDNYLTIENAIIQADEIYNNIYNMPFDWWYHSIKYGGMEPQNLRYSLANQEQARNLKNKIAASINAKFFTYSFSRTMPHKKQCTCFVCTRVYSLITNALRGQFSREVTIEEYFVSSYAPGDFLSTHTDTSKGVAFTWNLTKDWKSEYGGVLSIQDDHTISIIPKFNTLTIMNIENSVNHWVSEVSSMAPHNRIAISGWFDFI